MRENWKTVIIEEVAEVVGGGTPSTKEPSYWGGDIQWITPSEITAQEGRVISKTERTLTAAGLENSSAKLLPPGTVLLTSRATIGAVALAGAEMTTNQGFASLVPRRDIVLPHYLMYWCQLNKDEFIRRAGGNTFKEVSKKKVASVPISIPPLAEQQRIVDLISAIDQAINSALRTEDAATSAGRALRVEHFGAPIQLMTLAEAVDVTMGRQRAPKYQVGENIIPYLRAANVKDDGLELDDVLTMNFDPKEQRKYGLRSGDTLVTEGCGSIDEIGASAQWNDDLPGVVAFQNTLLRLRASTNVTHPDYVYQWARYAYESGAFARVSSGTNIFHIGAKRAAMMTLRVPELQEQVEVAETLTAVQEVEKHARNLAVALRATRESVLDQVLAGGHEIPDSYDRLLEEAS